jgi:hypothetical protein
MQIKSPSGDLGVIKKENHMFYIFLAPEQINKV